MELTAHDAHHSLKWLCPGICIALSDICGKQRNARDGLPTFSVEFLFCDTCCSAETENFLTYTSCVSSIIDLAVEYIGEHRPLQFCSLHFRTRCRCFLIVEIYVLVYTPFMAGSGKRLSVFPIL